MNRLQKSAAAALLVTAALVSGIVYAQRGVGSTTAPQGTTFREDSKIVGLRADGSSFLLTGDESLTDHRGERALPLMLQEGWRIASVENLKFGGQTVPQQGIQTVSWVLLERPSSRRP